MILLHKGTRLPPKSFLAHLRKPTIPTIAQPLTNLFIRLLQRCLIRDRFLHSTYAHLEPFKGSLTIWHASGTFPSPFECLEFAQNIRPGQNEITGLVEEWMRSCSRQRRGSHCCQDGVTSVAQKLTDFLPKLYPPVRNQSSEAQLASAVRALRLRIHPRCPPSQL